MRLGQAYHRRGEFVPAIEAVEEAIRPLDGERSQARFGVAALPAVIARGFLVWSLVELGRFGEALAPARESLRLAEAANQAYSVSWALCSFALLHLRQGDIGQAVPLLERGVALDRATEVPVMTAYQLAALGYVYALGGREKEGIPLLERSIEPAVYEKSGQHLFPFPRPSGWRSSTVSRCRWRWDTECAR
jgi:tetratricopeptide (TPR) repeat protein